MIATRRCGWRSRDAGPAESRIRAAGAIYQTVSGSSASAPPRRARRHRVWRRQPLARARRPRFPSVLVWMRSATTTSRPASTSFPRTSTGCRCRLADQFADVVAAVEVVEHLENPRAFCRELARIVKPGGWVVVTTPNQLSLLSLLTLVVKQRFSAFQDVSYPAHITALLETDLRRIARNAVSGMSKFGIQGKGGCRYRRLLPCGRFGCLPAPAVRQRRPDRPPAVVDRRPPVWVRALAATVPRMPLGRYWMVNQLRKVPAAPFMMRLPGRLGGFLYQCDQRDSVAREVCYTGQYEPQETQLMSGLLRPADVFVDVGANWGYFSLAAAHWVGRRGRVVAFEPEPRLYRMLVTNIAANEITWIEAHQTAIAAGDGRMSFVAFREDAGNWGDSRAGAHGGASGFRVRDARPRCHTRQRRRRQRAAGQDRR